MRLGTPKTPAPGGGVEPVFRLDMLSADELAGQGVTLLPALTPPTVNQGLVLNGTTQYAVARKNFILPAEFTMYFEFTPTFNYTVDANYVFSDSDALYRLLLLKYNNVNLNRILLLLGAGAIYVDGPNYGAIWRTNQRNKLCVVAATGAGLIYLNGMAVATANNPYTIGYFNNVVIGADYFGGNNFPGTFFDVQIYTRLLTAAEALQLTTVT